MTLEKQPEWLALQAHQTAIADCSIKELCHADHSKTRDTMFLRHGGITLDYSKNRITNETKDLLFSLLESRSFITLRDEMFSGSLINDSEGRAVLHTALRDQTRNRIEVSGENIKPKIVKALAQMEVFSELVRSGRWKGYTGKRIENIVHIGIGGSIQGPELVMNALKKFQHPELNFHFIANIDADEILSVMGQLDPETCLFLIASKSFTTQETMVNATTARRWVLDHYNGNKNAIASHFVALSSEVDKTKEFGISPENVFPFWDWVGGRYSLWSSIGLCIALSIGMERYRKLLQGAAEMDEHFKTAPLQENMPVLLAMIGVWYRNFWASPTYMVVPYATALKTLPRWVQQVDMESNGKSVDKQGNNVSYPTGPVVFGDCGTDAQHSYFQMLHQGTDLIPVDFIGIERPHHNLHEHHQILMANLYGQIEALVTGQEDNIDPHLNFTGNKPSNLILLDELTPKNLGALLALYEHKVFVQGCVWNINSFDQFGVELGKKRTRDILAA